jgi:hypothetical protein
MYRYNQTCCSKSQYSSSVYSTADDSFKYLDSLYSLLCPFVGFSDEPEMKLQTKLQLLILLKFFKPLQNTPANIPKYSTCNTCKTYLMRSPYWQVNRSSNSQESVTFCWGSHLFGVLQDPPQWDFQKHGLALWEQERLLRCFIISFIYYVTFF